MEPKVLIMLNADENVTLSINNASIADISALLLTVARNNKDAARALRLAVITLNMLESEENLKNI